MVPVARQRPARAGRLRACRGRRVPPAHPPGLHRHRVGHQPQHGVPGPGHIRLLRPTGETHAHRGLIPSSDVLSRPRGSGSCPVWIPPAWPPGCGRSVETGTVRQSILGVGSGDQILGVELAPPPIPRTDRSGKNTLTVTRRSEQDITQGTGPGTPGFRGAPFHAQEVASCVIRAETSWPLWLSPCLARPGVRARWSSCRCVGVEPGCRSAG